MKKSLLTLGLLGLAGSAFAQRFSPPGSQGNGPWTMVNTNNVSTSASFIIDQLVTLSPTFTWGIAYDQTSTVASPPKNNSVRAVEATGTEFDFNTIIGTAGYQPTNITVPAGAPGNLTAFCGQYATGATNGGGGEVLRTVDGGARWRKISTATMFTQPDGFCNWAYAFDADNVVAGGDPNPLPSGGGAGQFEFWYTNNASNASNPTPANVTWTQCTNMPAPLDAVEYALVGSYTAVGDTIWAGTSHEVAGAPAPARVLRSVDKGHTWTVASTPLLGAIGNICFKDGRHGIAYTLNTTGVSGYATSSDGGLTWTSRTLPDPLSADTLTGKFYFGGIAAIPHVGFVSYGPAVSNSRFVGVRGASFSVDGFTPYPGDNTAWVDIDKGRDPVGGFLTSYNAASFVNGPDVTVPTPNGPEIFKGYLGYLGSITAASSSTAAGGEGGIYQVNTGAYAPKGRILGTKRSAELQRSLTVSPNPSTGIFQVELANGIKNGTVLTVFDAMGRTVLNRELTATAAGSKTVKIDLSKEKTGVYTLRLTTTAGIATSKLVIE